MYFLKKWGGIGKEERRKKVNKDHSLSKKRQCELLEVNSSSFYSITQKESSFNDELMKLITNKYLETTFFGVPRMTEYLRSIDHRIKPKLIRRLYRLMDLHAIGPQAIPASLIKEKDIAYSLICFEKQRLTDQTRHGGWLFAIYQLVVAICT